MDCKEKIERLLSRFDFSDQATIELLADIIVTEVANSFDGVPFEMAAWAHIGIAMREGDALRRLGKASKNVCDFARAELRTRSMFDECTWAASIGDAFNQIISEWVDFHRQEFR